MTASIPPTPPPAAPAVVAQSGPTTGNGRRFVSVPWVSFTSCHCRSRFLAVIIPARSAPLEGAGLSPATHLRPPRQAAKPGVNLGVGSLCPAPSLLILIPEWNIFGACFLPYPQLCGTCWELAGYSWRSGFVERLLPPPPPCRVVTGEMYAAHKKDCRFLQRLCGLRRWHFSIQRGD